MKSRKNLIEQLKSLPYFDKSVIYQLGRSYNLADATIKTYISRYIKSKEIIRLRKDIYISEDFYNENKSDISYSFYLANIIRTPSYITSWTALEYYNLITDVIHSVISVAPKITKTHTTKAGSFEYHSISKELFSDFSLVKGKFDFFLASPSKALFDLLYFKTHQFKGIKLEMIDGLIRDLRVDIDEMDKEEVDKFYLMVKKYIHHNE